jgi:hypothetical protein
MDAALVSSQLRVDAVVEPDQRHHLGDPSWRRAPGWRSTGSVVARLAGTLALVCAMASPALAGGVCVQVDTGNNAGALIVLKKVKLGARAVGPADGFIALFSGGQYSFFFPLDGQALNNSAHDLAVGLTSHKVGFNAAGTLGGGGPATEIGIRCVAGPDKKVNVLDQCDFFFDGTGATGHVVECSAAPSLP